VRQKVPIRVRDGDDLKVTNPKFLVQCTLGYFFLLASKSYLHQNPTLHESCPKEMRKT